MLKIEFLLSKISSTMSRRMYTDNRRNESISLNNNSIDTNTCLYDAIYKGMKNTNNDTFDLFEMLIPNSITFRRTFGNSKKGEMMEDDEIQKFVDVFSDINVIIIGSPDSERTIQSYETENPRYTIVIKFIPKHFEFAGTIINDESHRSNSTDNFVEIAKQIFYNIDGDVIQGVYDEIQEEDISIQEFIEIFIEMGGPSENISYNRDDPYHTIPEIEELPEPPTLGYPNQPTSDFVGTAMSIFSDLDVNLIIKVYDEMSEGTQIDEFIELLTDMS